MTKKSTYNILAIVQGDPNVNAGARLRIYNWANDLHNYRKDICDSDLKPKNQMS